MPLSIDTINVKIGITFLVADGHGGAEAI